MFLFVFPGGVPEWLTKAHVHGHYRINRKTGARIWVDSYDDKRPERHRASFESTVHRVTHFQHALSRGRTREAMQAFHDLGHDDAHVLARHLGLAGEEKGASKKDLMESIYGAVQARKHAAMREPRARMEPAAAEDTPEGVLRLRELIAKNGGQEAVVRNIRQKLSSPDGAKMMDAIVSRMATAALVDRKTVLKELGISSKEIRSAKQPAATDPPPARAPADPNAKPRREDYATAAEHLAAIESWRRKTGNLNEHELKREERADRLDDAAQRARQEARAHHSRADDISQRFYMGQPILVGHHSERRARRDHERMDNAMRASIAANEKAADLAGRAHAARENTAISSDDDDAVEKLAAKIEQAEAVQARMKAINAAHRKFLKNPASLDSADLTDAEKHQIRTYKPQYSWEPNPVPPYALTNANANLRRMKERMADLQRQRTEREAAGGARKTVPFDGGEIEHNADANRVQIKFHGKPDKAMRDNLKSRGFRWSPSEKAWQRQLNNAAIYAAENIVGLR